MDTEQFRVHGKEMVDYICDYMKTIRKRKVYSTVEPGYLAPLLPNEAPQKPEKWSAIMKDIEDKIMPGVTHWQHPQFHAYFPNGNSYPSILGDMISDIIGCVGFSWAASPACTELETIVMDWYGKALNLPPEFLFNEPGSTGGGVLQSSASECILVSMLAARRDAINYLMEKNNAFEEHESEFLPQLVAYCSTESHSCVEKDAMIALVKLRILESDENGSLRGYILQEAIDEDLKQGLHPFFISAIVGSTGVCSYDNLTELGKIAKSLPACWFHVDGAYAGNSFICPEFRFMMKGLDYADSFNTNCNKWLTVCYDCSCLWVKDRIKLTAALTVDPVYLQHSNSKVAIDYRHWGIPLSRRFRSLKLWFTLRNYGIEGLQKYIRNHCKLAKYFESLLRKDDRFETVFKTILGLVTFRLKGSDALNQRFLSSINASGSLHMVPTKYKNNYVIRFCVTYQYATEEDIDLSWSIIQKHATEILAAEDENVGTREMPPQLRKKLSKRHSFIRSVSRDFYEKRNMRSSLQDGATPISVVSDEVNDNDDVFVDP